MTLQGLAFGELEIGMALCSLKSANYPRCILAQNDRSLARSIRLFTEATDARRFEFIYTVSTRRRDR